ncbi:orotidine-5'-phosphate decarboxylase [Aeoliella mucimassa]|uniref:Orotidine 5'-phosphate decarboxylase n=1 Tax=Aeoliella mucimassa TaxID=2527972 RepID=A0A518AJM0_9BACT|nr:orotidine-5'-phosphate decarboxylase [Aeoliella mucimassa]QDU54929.1 Orotidine 5'-phosphate decarboxylase [Aeoliella mucimassa]
MTQPFFDRLTDQVRTKKTPLVVGLDPRWSSLPETLKSVGDSLAEKAAAYRDFSIGILDVVAPLVPAVKPQVAFFEQLGWQGMQALAEVIDHARKLGVLLVMDGKRNDIGSTAEGYADGWLGESSAWRGDALTVSPYLGDDSLEPFVQVASDRAAGLFVLVKTSNPGGKMLQDLTADGSTIYQHVGGLVERLAADSAGACGYGVTGAVVGATYPEQLGELRALMPHTWFLVPGYGSQGGTAADVAPAFDANGLGAIVNSSRAIIFAHARDEFANLDWQQAVEAATRKAIDDLSSVATIR